MTKRQLLAFARHYTVTLRDPHLQSVYVFTPDKLWALIYALDDIAAKGRPLAVEERDLQEALRAAGEQLPNTPSSEENLES